jgi:two-component system, OmpR family, sensor histidine kinase BaeS
MANRPGLRLIGIGELGRRLVLAFVGVALATVAIAIGIATATPNAAVNGFVARQEVDLTNAVGAAAGIAYPVDLGWHGARLAPVMGLVDRDAAALQVRSQTGGLVQSSPGYGSLPAKPALSAPVMAQGAQVGSVTVRFGRQGVRSALGAFGTATWRVRIYSAAIAVLLALIVSAIVARRITAPLERMLAIMRARAAGDRDARLTVTREVGVLRELLEGFNTATDALDQQDRARRNLVADVAHELRTPVAVLRAGHEAMLDGITEPTPDNLSSLRDEVLRLSRMIEDLQSLAAAEAAALQLRRVPLDLAAVAGGAAASMSELFEAAGVTLTTQLTKVHILGDDERIREVVTNLLTNAMKYTTAGGTVVLETGPQDQRLARLRVSDTGIGIAPSELPHVTERFFRGRRSAEMAGGTGIGLTILAELVRAHRGEMQITSEPGRGTQVTVTLPRAANVS